MTAKPPQRSAAVPRARPVDFAIRLLRSLSTDDLGGLAARMAFFFMLSLFPGLILLVALLDALPLESALVQLADDIRRTLPGPAAELLEEYLREFGQRKPSGVVSLWGLLALWTASRGLADARKNLNIVFGVTEKRPVWRLRIVSFFMTIAAILLLTLAYVVLLGGPELGSRLADVALVGDAFALLWKLARWPLILSFLTGFVVLVYRFLPYRRVPFRYLVGGAVPVVAGWIGLGLGFRLYIRHFANYDELYGSLTSVILLMVFLWLFSLLLLFGGEVAANLAGLRPLGPDHEPEPPARPPPEENS